MAAGQDEPVNLILASVKLLAQTLPLQLPSRITGCELCLEEPLVLNTVGYTLGPEYLSIVAARWNKEFQFTIKVFSGGLPIT